MVASIRIANAIPNPSIFMIETPDEANEPKVTARIKAAAVMIRPERCRPMATQFTVFMPASCCSLILESRNNS